MDSSAILHDETPDITYIYRKKIEKLFSKAFQLVMIQVHPNLRVGKPVCITLGNWLSMLIKQILRHAAAHPADADEKTISQTSIETAVKSILPEELLKHALSEGIKAITVPPINPIFISSLKNCVELTLLHKPTLNKQAAVFLGAVIEYLIAEVLELSGNQTLDNRKRTASEKDMSTVIMADDELTTLFTCVLGRSRLDEYLKINLPPKLASAIQLHKTINLDSEN